MTGVIIQSGLEFRALPEAISSRHVVEMPLNIIQEEPGLAFVLALVFLVGFAVMGLGAKHYQTGRLIKNTPPEKVRSMAVGRTELHGTAKSAGVEFDNPLTNGKCLYYSYSVMEEREWTETNKDGEKEKKKQWKTVSSQTLAAPFLLDDGTGEVLVLANGGASFHISDSNSFSKTFRGSGRIPGQYRKNVDTSVDIAEAMPEDVEIETHNLAAKIDDKIPLLSVPGTSTGRVRRKGSPKQPKYEGSGRGTVKRRRIKQEVLPVDEDVYVYGAATIRENYDAASSNEERLVIQGDDDTGRFIVSCKDESGVAKGFFRKGVMYFAGGLLVSTAIFGWFVVNLI